MYYSKKEKYNPIILYLGFAEHHLGEFTINGINYNIAVKSDRATYRINSKIKLWRENEDSEPNLSQSEIAVNGFSTV